MHRAISRKILGVLSVVVLAGCDDGRAAVVVDPGPMVLARGELRQQLQGNVRGTLTVDELLAGMTPTDAALCRGYYERSSVVMLELIEPMQVRAAVEQPSTSPDTTMVIRGPGRTLCDDDSNGQLRPRIDQVLGPGIWWIHVGTFTEGMSTAWTLDLTVRPARGRAAAAARQGEPARPGAGNAADPAAGAAAAESGPDVAVVPLVAGLTLSHQGVVESGNRTQPRADALNGGRSVSGCRGYVEDLPSFRFHIDAARDVTVTVTDSAGRDSVMMLAGPSGVYCDDDSAGGLRPQLVERLGPGVWDVYVGSYSEGTGQPMAYALQVLAR